MTFYALRLSIGIIFQINFNKVNQANQVRSNRERETERERETSDDNKINTQFRL